MTKKSKTEDYNPHVSEQEMADAESPYVGDGPPERIPHPHGGEWHSSFRNNPAPLVPADDGDWLPPVRTSGISPKLIATVLASVIAYVLGQEVLEIPAATQVAGQAVLVAIAAWFAGPGTVVRKD